MMLEQRPVPIVTVAIDGGYRLRGLSGIARMGRTRYRVRFLSVHQPPVTKKDLRLLVDQMRDEIASQVERWRHQEPTFTPS